MYASIAIIVAVIVLWSCFDFSTTPSHARWRFCGISTLIGIGCWIYFSPQPSPILIGAESFIIALVVCTLIPALLLLAGGDRPTRRYEVITWVSITALFVVTLALAYVVGGGPALCGAQCAELVLLLGVGAQRLSGRL